MQIKESILFEYFVNLLYNKIINNDNCKIKRVIESYEVSCILKNNETLIGASNNEGKLI